MHAHFGMPLKHREIHTDIEVLFELIVAPPATLC